MSFFSLVQVAPLQVLQTFMADAPPNPVLWPDGSVTHGIATTGGGHGPWAILPSSYGPNPPTPYHVLSTTTPVFTGTSILFQQTWVPQPLPNVQSALLSVVSSNIGQSMASVLDVNPASLFIFQERLAEARSLASWFLATTAPAATASYPLLFATVGIEHALDGSVSTTMANIMFRVLNSYSQWVTVVTPVMRAIASAHATINACTTVIDAVNAFNTVNLSAGVGTAVSST